MVLDSQPHTPPAQLVFRELPCAVTNGQDADAAQACALPSSEILEEITAVAAASASCNSAAAPGRRVTRGGCSRQCVISLAASLALREPDVRLQSEQTGRVCSTYAAGMLLPA